MIAGQMATKCYHKCSNTVNSMTRIAIQNVLTYDHINQVESVIRTDDRLIASTKTL